MNKQNLLENDCGGANRYWVPKILKNKGKQVYAESN
jgi:hypothetical protein